MHIITLSRSIARALILLLFSGVTLQAVGQGQPVAITKVGAVALTSSDNKFLQAHAAAGDTGELHASNPHVNQEETWWLLNYGPPSQRLVLLQNWRNNYYLERHGGGANNHRAGAVAHDPTFATIWTMVPGSQYGLAEDVVAFRAQDGGWLKALEGGHNAAGEPGEVYVDTLPGPSGNRGWNGWWRVGEVTDHPEPGKNPWTTFGDGLSGIVNGVYDVVSFVLTGSNQPNNQGQAPVQQTIMGACVYHLGTVRFCSSKTIDQCFQAQGQWFANEPCASH